MAMSESVLGCEVRPKASFAEQPAEALEQAAFGVVSSARCGLGSSDGFRTGADVGAAHGWPANRAR